MKRNLLSIVIMALVLVNTILTVIMMVSVVGMANKTTALVNGISEALSLEIESQYGSGSPSSVPMTNIVVYTIPDSMTIPLAENPNGDGQPHYCLLEVSFSINNQSDGFKTYGADLSAQESLIKDEIYSVVSKYTIEEAKTSQDMMKEQILERVQQMYASDFIFNVSFGQCMFQ